VLQQLQEVSLNVEFDDHAKLLRLVELSTLQKLALSYTTAGCAAAAAPTWQHLPQL
jgi:hypothetical protein